MIQGLREKQQIKDIHRFIKKALLLALPVLLCVPVLIFLFISGELYFNGIDDIVACQSKKETCMMGFAYTNPDVLLKLKMTTTLRPDILVLGSSRAMPFRREFFSTNSFYNAGGAISRLPHFRNFFSKLPKDYAPKILIISLDQYFFNEKWDSLPDVEDFNESLSIDFGAYAVGSKSLNGFLTDLVSKKYSFAQISSIFIKQHDFNRRGLSSKLHTSGFINDGSYYFGQNISKPNDPESLDYNFKDTLDRINTGSRRFQFGSEVNPRALEELSLFLQECKLKNIYVVGFFPPFANIVFKKMQSMGDNYSYIDKLFPYINPLFARYDYPLLDASDISSIGSIDKETIDGFHGSEKAYLRLFIKLVELDGKHKLKAVSKPVEELKAKLLTVKGDLSVFPI